jgi:hypothetical protein
MNEISPNATERTYGDVLARAFAIPFENPPAPEKFFDRPALTVSYRTDLDKVQALVPEPHTQIAPPSRAQPLPIGGYLEPYRHPTSQSPRKEPSRGRCDYSGDRPCG